MLKFLSGLRRGLTASPAPTKVQNAPPFDPNPHIRDAILSSGLTNGREQDLAFYMGAHAEGMLNGRDIRKRGEHRLSPEKKKSAGLIFRGVVTEEFMATLNDRGRSDPEAAAFIIAGIATQRCSTTRQLNEASQMDLFVEFLPSNMAAGACQSASGLRGQRFTPRTAPFVPFHDCTHPDQCACNYVTRLSLDSEY